MKIMVSRYLATVVTGILTKTTQHPEREDCNTRRQKKGVNFALGNYKRMLLMRQLVFFY